MKKYKFSDDLFIINNWNNLRKDLESEGVEFGFTKIKNNYYKKL